MGIEIAISLQLNGVLTNPSTIDSVFELIIHNCYKYGLINGASSERKVVNDCIDQSCRFALRYYVTWLLMVP